MRSISYCGISARIWGTKWTHFYTSNGSEASHGVPKKRTLQKDNRKTLSEKKLLCIFTDASAGYFVKKEPQQKQKLQTIQNIWQTYL